VSQATCDRSPLARPASAAVAATPLGVEVATAMAWIATAAARPAMSLSGRTAVNQ
jgi:hypothetical protein